MALTTAEKKVQTNIQDYLKRLKAEGYPIYQERRQAGGFSYKEGVPDLWFTFNGIHVEIEVKGLGGSPSSSQLSYERKMKDVGNFYLRPSSVKEVEILVEQVLIPSFFK